MNLNNVLSSKFRAMITLKHFVLVKFRKQKFFSVVLSES